MKEVIVRYFIIGIVFIIGLVCLGVFFQIDYWVRWILFTVGYFLILLPALEYWNEKLKDKK